MSRVTMLSLMAIGTLSGPPAPSPATWMNAFSFALCSPIARSDAPTYSRAETWRRASVNGSDSGSLTDYLRHDEVAIAPGRRIAGHIVAGDTGLHFVVTHRGFAQCGAGNLAGVVNFAELIDVREDLGHLGGHALQRGVIEFQMSQVCDATRFVARDFHARSLAREDEV